MNFQSQAVANYNRNKTGGVDDDYKAAQNIGYRALYHTELI